MNADEFADWLRNRKGMVRLEPLPKDLLDRIVAEEATVVSSFGTPVKNTGLEDCLKRNTLFMGFVDETFWLPPEISMKLRNSDGTVVGHDLPADMLPEYQGRDDIMFLSDDFIMYADKEMDAAPYMEMLAYTLRGEDGSLPESVNAVFWCPSPTSNTFIHQAYGQEDTGLATTIFAADLD